MDRQKLDSIVNEIDPVKEFLDVLDGKIPQYFYDLGIEKRPERSTVQKVSASLNNLPEGFTLEEDYTNDRKLLVYRQGDWRGVFPLSNKLYLELVETGITLLIKEYYLAEATRKEFNVNLSAPPSHRILYG